ncbi:MAG TPA: hypothetical protein VF310_12020, partial [Vicinamibacteria bacterium]
RVGETTFRPEPATYALPPFAAAAGWHELELRSLDGAEPGPGREAAPLSVAASEIRLHALAPLREGERLALGTEGADVYVGPGWSQAEGFFRWSDGTRATLYLPRAEGSAVLLRLRVRPFAGGSRRSQRLRLDWNDRALGEVELHGPATLRAVLEAGEGGLSALSFHLPDAAAPGGGADRETRALGVAVEWLALEAPPRVPAGAPLPCVQAGWLAVEEDDGEHAAHAPPWPLVSAFALDPPAPVRVEAAFRLGDPTRSPALAVSLNGREVERLDGGGPPRLALAVGAEALAARTVLAVAPGPDPPPGAVVLARPTLQPAPTLALGHPLPLFAPGAEPFLGRGWSEAENEQRWTDGGSAQFVLGAGEVAVLRLRLHPFLSAPQVPRQRMAIQHQGHTLTEVSLDATSPALVACTLPRRAAPGIVTLALPDAAAPAALGLRADSRRLAVAAEWLRLDAFPTLALGATLRLGGSEASPFLGSGWSDGEGSFRWTDGPAAELFLDGPTHAGALLEMTLRPLVQAPAIPRQRVEVRANGEPIGALDLATPGVATHTVFVPPGRLAGPSVLRLVLPDAVPPAQQGVGTETRRLGVALHALRLRPLAGLAPQQRLALGGAGADAFLGEGWSQAEGALRWTDGTRAELLFELKADPKDAPRVLQLRLRPQTGASLPRQRLQLRLNGREVTTLTLTDPAPAVYAVALPRGALARQNRLELLTPDAVVPAQAGAGPDTRRLGVAVYWLRFAPWF